MSTYYYKNTSIKLDNGAIKYIINSTVAGVFKYNGSSVFTLQSSYTSAFTTTVNEIPSDTGYNYNSTDISTYCIATWAESSSSDFSSSSIPSWCNKIRAVLIGGGGGGITGPNANSYDTNTDYTHNVVNHQHDHGTSHYGNDNDIQSQPHNHTTYHNGGGGGGGGGFIYLSTYDITNTKSNVNISLGKGGTANTAGGNTQISLSTTKSYTVGGGGSGTSGTVTGGSAGTAPSTDYYVTTSVSGKKGSNGYSENGGSGSSIGDDALNIINDSTIKTYGKGGNGTATSGIAGGSGTNGYYRIYFLSS